MCGIAGFWNANKENRIGNEKNLEKVAETLKHRGPDGYGIHYDSKSEYGVVHTRLAIIDLNTGDQPIIDRRNNLVLAANGEFYDFKKIRGHLVTEGHKFITKSDSEIALKLYKKHGLDFVNHLRGEFAFSLFDEEKQELILVRDRFGIRPLYFYKNESSLAFASEIKALFDMKNIPREISNHATLHQLMQVMVPGQTLFKNIYALKPGHILVAKKRNGRLIVEEKQYWDANFPENGHHLKEDEDTVIKRVREKLVESVALRLEADVPVACYLSGGIDSCAILGMASSIQQSPVKGFTISFDDDRFDEADIAKEMAQSCNADQDILNISASDLYGQNFEKALWHSERTFYNTLGVAKMLMSKHVTESGYKVVITGEGSDEIFGGYAAFKRDMFLHGGSGNGLEMEAKLKASNQVFSGSILAEKEINHPAFKDLMGFTPSWIQPWMLTLEKIKPLLSDNFLESLSGYDPIEAIVNSFSPSALRGRHPLDQAQYTWIKTMLEGQILNWGGDRVDMAYSLESRPAFLDHKVVELALQIPPHYRIKDGIEKWILREAMKNILPERLYKREKFAFMAPPSHTDNKKGKAIADLVNKYLGKEERDSFNLLNESNWSNFIKDFESSTDSAFKTRGDIILNHVTQLHALNSTFR